MLDLGTRNGRWGQIDASLHKGVHQYTIRTPSVREGVHCNVSVFRNIGDDSG